MASVRITKATRNAKGPMASDKRIEIMLTPTVIMRMTGKEISASCRAIKNSVTQSTNELIEIWPMGSGGGNFAAKRDLDVLDESAGRELQDIRKSDARFEYDIVNHAGGLVMKMAVLAEVRAVA